MRSSKLYTQHRVFVKPFLLLTAKRQSCLTLLEPEAGDFVEFLVFYKIAINDLEILILCYSEQVEGAIQIYTTTSTREFYLPPSLQPASHFRR
jgi:hypothetical protein